MEITNKHIEKSLHMMEVKLILHGLLNIWC